MILPEQYDLLCEYARYLGVSIRFSAEVPKGDLCRDPLRPDSYLLHPDSLEDFRRALVTHGVLTTAL